ncbi:MAG: urease accessory protein, partial [Verrucomicrobia bacterium]|nr:urease accessory protein [Verrucomicrobiota bacterium]
MKFFRINSPALAMSAVLMSFSAAHAHHAEFMSGKPFLQGVSMPVHGLDHLLSAFAVGLVAAQSGGRLRWMPV